MELGLSGPIIPFILDISDNEGLSECTCTGEKVSGQRMLTHITLFMQPLVDPFDKAQSGQKMHDRSE